jgi:hypothetical protein
MALELHVFIDSDKVPTHAIWQQSIASLGFPATIQEPFNPRTDTGFNLRLIPSIAPGSSFTWNQQSRSLQHTHVFATRLATVMRAPPFAGVVI